MHATTISMHYSDLKNIILDVFVTYQHCLQVKESLQQENVQHKFKGRDIKEDGFIMQQNRIYVPSYGEIRNLVLKEMHNVAYAGHASYQKIIAMVISQSFWSKMKKDVID